MTSLPNRNDWARVEGLFHDALEQPEAAREQWLAAQACPENVREDVRSLLESNRIQEELAAAGSLQPLDERDALPREPVGPYRVIQLLGRGGMGAVFLAERTDGQFQHKVAVKFLAAHLTDEEFLKRFMNERQVLASLSHPNITQLFDGGVTASGSPYLVMEYVEGGEPLNRYCDTRRLSIRERLDLFLQVCAAVDYLHSNMILHRDLKPGNILVTTSGIVKLVDFGTAAILGDQADSTVTAMRLMTPRYASPERLRGERANLKSDVFSLGVILYELLAGAWPFGNPESIVEELRRATGESTPTDLAGGITADAAGLRGIPQDRLRRLLRGDLSAICSKALEPDPARRYGAVQILKEDIERYLDGRPVKARTPTALYRAGKFVLRNKFAVGAAALVLAIVSAAVVTTLRQARIARDEARKAEKVTEFLTQMLGSASQSTFNPKTYTVAQMLDAARGNLESRWKDDPAVEAALRLSLGSSYYMLNDLEQAEFQIRTALDIYRRLGDGAGVARALGMMAANSGVRGVSTEAIRYYEEALAQYERLGRSAPTNEVMGAKLALAEYLALVRRSDLPRARKLTEEALVLARKNPGKTAELGRANYVLSAVALEQGDRATAEKAALEAVGILRQVPGVLVVRPLYELMIMNSRRRNFSAAAEFAKESYETMRRNLGDDHPQSADFFIMWCRYRAESGNADQLAQEAVAALPRMRNKFPAQSSNLWNPLQNIARILNLAGRNAEAEAFEREALAIIDKQKLGEADPRRGQTLLELGRALLGQRKNREAGQVLERAARCFEATGGEWSSRAREIREDLLRRARAYR